MRTPPAPGLSTSPRRGSGVGARRWVAQRLEGGDWRTPLPRAASWLWGCLARPERQLELPAETRVIGVSGATLGGSGASDMVLALACGLADRGVSVAVAAHCYRGALPDAARVSPGADPRRVGDEALWLARALAPRGVPVFGGPTWQGTLDLAARDRRVVLADSLLQAEPNRLTLSLLVVDAESPWGAGLCPPAGDLRARRAALLQATDRVVTNGSLDEKHVAPIRRETGALPFAAVAHSRGVTTAAGELIPWHGVPRRSAGLLLAIARPERVVRALATRGVRPRHVVLRGDHDPISQPVTFQPGPTVSAWLTTQKCATKLGGEYRGAPVWVIDYRVRIPEELLDQVEQAERRATRACCRKPSGAGQSRPC